LVKDPFLEYMIKTQVDPYDIWTKYDPHKYFEQTTRSDVEITAVWSFLRYGRTTTRYKDRYNIHIGGECGDFYDTDFLIYNDVIVDDGAGRVWIYAYPKDIFPPTDFHSATLLGDDYGQIPQTLEDSILIVGCAGYQDERYFWETPVFRLDLKEMSIERIETSGEYPGWILEHRASLEDGGKLVISGGKILDEQDKSNPNLNRFELDLWTRKWTKYA